MPLHPSREEHHAYGHPNGRHARCGRLAHRPRTAGICLGNIGIELRSGYYYGSATPYVGDRANDDIAYFQVWDAL